MVNQCAVEGCSNNSKFLNRWKNQWCFVCQGPRAKSANVRKCRCRCKVPYSLYQFPARKEDNATREIWMALIGPGIPDRVALWSPMANYHVCSDHFVDGMPTPENPHPTIKLGYKLIGNSSVHVKNPSAEKSDPKTCFLDEALNYSSSDSFPIKSEPVTESCEIGPIVNKAIPAVLNSANGLLPAGAVSQTATNLGPEDAHSSYDTEIAANIKSEPMWVDASACDIDRSSINQESSTINQETATNNIKTELLPETDQVYLPTVCQQQTSTLVKPILVANVFSQIQAPGVCDNNAGAVCHQNAGLVPNQPPLNNQTGASTSPSHKEDPNRSNGHVVPKVYTRQVKGTKPNNVVMGTYCDPRNIHVTDSDLDGLIRLKDCPISYLVDTTATDQSEHFPPGSPLACLIPVMKPPPKS